MCIPVNHEPNSCTIQDMASKYPPYVNAYGKISKLFDAIRAASVPPKFSQDFLSASLGFQSSSDRAMISLLKNLGFLDASNLPTQAYKNYRDDSQSRAVMAAQIKSAYSQIFSAHEYAHKLSRQELQGKLKTLLGVSDSDANLAAAVGTFMELVKLADFDVVAEPNPKSDQEDVPLQTKTTTVPLKNHGFGLSYTINLNLPATTEVEVFNAIFKSLRANLLSDDE